jgi:hypothetical protein
MSFSVTWKYKSSFESNALSYSSKSGTVHKDEAITAQVEGVLGDINIKYKALRALLWRTMTSDECAGIAQHDSEITAAHEKCLPATYFLIEVAAATYA